MDAGVMEFFIAVGAVFPPLCDVWLHSGNELPVTAATVADAPKSKSLRERLPGILSIEGAAFICPSLKVVRCRVQWAGLIERLRIRIGNLHHGRQSTQREKYAPRQTFSAQAASHSAMLANALYTFNSGNGPLNFRDYLELEAANMVVG
jgi:hypothetical protein